MKPIFSRALTILAVLTAPVFAHAQTEIPATDESTGEARSIPLLNDDQLDELLGPIALYPDALIALILPAATMPTDLVLASRYLGAGGDTAKVDQQPWDEAVQALARYPDVVKWMDDKLSWAIMVGDAFVAQPVDVMKSVQRLRARARAAGTLVDSAEQKIVEEEGNIRIVPAQPEVIYVPVYDPQVVYVAPSWGWSRPVISYRWCYPTGVWLSYDCDWYNHRVWVVNSHWRHSWYYDRVWCRPSHPRRYYHAHDRDYGHGWSPRHGDRRDHRRDRRDRDDHVVIRDGRREYPSIPRSGGFRSNPSERRDDVVRRDNNHRDDDHRGEARRGDDRPRDRFAGDRDGRDDRRSTPGSRDTSRPDRRPEAPRVVTRPGGVQVPRVDVPSDAPAVVNRPSTPSNPRPSSGRWIDRATNPGNAPRVRSETATPPVRTETPARVVPAPRTAPRVTPAPESARSPERTATVRVPLPGGGSRTTVVNSGGERRSEASAPRGEGGSRPNRGGGGNERRAERQKGD